MTSAPTNPLDVPPYQIQGLIPSVDGSERLSSTDVPSSRVICAQALGSEIYVGCANGELLRFALQADDPNKLESYRLLSRQTVPNSKPIDEIFLVPCISRALILSERQIHFYTIPSLDAVSLNIIKPIRNVVTLAIDHQHIKRPPPPLFSSSLDTQPVEFCVIKRSNIAMYSLHEKLYYHKEIPLPQGATLACRAGHHLCIANKDEYSVIDLEKASGFPILPLVQAQPPSQVVIKPFIIAVSEQEFLILSWTGSGTLGVFINAEGDPVRGTLEWPGHPEDLCLDYPYIASLHRNNTIEIHNLETQAITQVISVPPSPDGLVERLRLTSCLNGYLVPSTQKSDKMRLVSVPLLRTGAVGEATT